MNKKIFVLSLVLIIISGFIDSGYLNANKKIIFEDDFEYYPINSFPSSGEWILKFNGKINKLACDIDITF